MHALLHVTDIGLADSTVARPQAGFAGQEFHPTVEAKAASLLLGLARNHPFIDGNKRIAVLATLLSPARERGSGGGHRRVSAQEVQGLGGGVDHADHGRVAAVACELAQQWDGGHRLGEEPAA